VGLGWTWTDRLSTESDQPADEMDSADLEDVEPFVREPFNTANCWAIVLMPPHLVWKWTHATWVNTVAT